jgi:hypothetical protein
LCRTTARANEKMRIFAKPGFASGNEVFRLIADVFMQ